MRTPANSLRLNTTKGWLHKTIKPRSKNLHNYEDLLIINTISRRIRAYQKRSNYGLIFSHAILRRYLNRWFQVLFFLYDGAWYEKRFQIENLKKRRFARKEKLIGFWRKPGRILNFYRQYIKPRLILKGKLSAEKLFLFKKRKIYKKIARRYKHRRRARRRRIWRTFIIRQLIWIFRFRFYISSYLRSSKFHISFNFIEPGQVTSGAIVRYIIGSLTNRFRVRGTVYRLIRGLRDLRYTAGLMVQASGRFTRKQRASREEIKTGIISLNQFYSKTRYAFNQVTLKYSVCGIKVWVPPPSSFFSMCKIKRRRIYRIKNSLTYRRDRFFVVRRIRYWKKTKIGPIIKYYNALNSVRPLSSFIRVRNFFFNNKISKKVFFNNKNSIKAIIDKNSEKIFAIKNDKYEDVFYDNVKNKKYKDFIKESKRNNKVDKKNRKTTCIAHFYLSSRTIVRYKKRLVKWKSQYFLLKRKRIKKKKKKKFLSKKTRKDIYISKKNKKNIHKKYGDKVKIARFGNKSFKKFIRRSYNKYNKLNRKFLVTKFINMYPLLIKPIAKINTKHSIIGKKFSSQFSSVHLVPNRISKINNQRWVNKFINKLGNNRPIINFVNKFVRMRQFGSKKCATNKFSNKRHVVKFIDQIIKSYLIKKIIFKFAKKVNKFTVRNIDNNNNHSIVNNYIKYFKRYFSSKYFVKYRYSKPLIKYLSKYKKYFNKYNRYNSIRYNNNRYNNVKYNNNANKYNNNRYNNVKYNNNNVNKYNNNRYDNVKYNNNVNKYNNNRYNNVKYNNNRYNNVKYNNRYNNINKYNNNRYNNVKYNNNRYNNVKYNNRYNNINKYNNRYGRYNFRKRNFRKFSKLRFFTYSKRFFVSRKLYACYKRYKSQINVYFKHYSKKRNNVVKLLKREKKLVNYFKDYNKDKSKYEKIRKNREYLVNYIRRSFKRKFRKEFIRLVIRNKNLLYKFRVFSRKYLKKNKKIKPYRFPQKLMDKIRLKRKEYYKKKRKSKHNRRKNK